MANRKALVAEHPLDFLPFVGKKKPTPSSPHCRDFWAVHSTGRYADDCLLGAAYARQALVYVHRHGSIYLIADVVKEIAAKGSTVEAPGLVTGFFEVIGTALLGVEILDG